MRTSVTTVASRTRTLALALPLLMIPSFALHAHAEPQAAGVLAPDGIDGASKKNNARAAPIGAAQDNTPQSTAKTPKKPDAPTDNTIFAPPLAGYVVMFLLGAAVVMLNLWSSKRTQLD